jgi:hypothetical protein
MGRPLPGPPDQPEGTGPPRSPPAPGLCGPGRCWSWPPRPRPGCGLGGSASRRRPGSGWSPAAGHPAVAAPGHVHHPARRRRGVRCVRAARLAERRAPDQRPDPPVRQMVRDLLLHARHGRTSGLPPAGPGRDGAAPWPVTTIVSCLPVLVLAMGTTLAHMLRADADTGHGTRGPAAGRPPPGPARTRPGHPRTRPRAQGHPPKPVLPPGQQRSHGRTTGPACAVARFWGRS